MPVTTIPHTRWGSKEQPQHEWACSQKCFLWSYRRFADVELKLILSEVVTQVRLHIWGNLVSNLCNSAHASFHECQITHWWYILNICCHHDSAVNDSNANRFSMHRDLSARRPRWSVCLHTASSSLFKFPAYSGSPSNNQTTEACKMRAASLECITVSQKYLSICSASHVCCNL